MPWSSTLIPRMPGKNRRCAGLCQDCKRFPSGRGNEDAALLGCSEINGAAGVYCNACGAARPCLFKRKQGSAFGFKFVDETGASVGKENIAERAYSGAIAQRAHRAYPELCPCLPRSQEIQTVAAAAVSMRGIGAISAGGQVKKLPRSARLAGSFHRYGSEFVFGIRETCVQSW